MIPAAVLVPQLVKQSGRPGSVVSSDSAFRSSGACLEEALGLSSAIGLDIVYSEVIRLSKIQPATLLGSGKVRDLSDRFRVGEVELVVIDHPLSPIQQRNLERKWNCKVLDRTAVILEIFGDRARTKEGKLQVDLAHLNWQKSRLVRSWTHLERQRGGAGFMGGPGETQLESDRRQIQARISKLERELDQVKRTRGLHRKQRKKIPHMVVALVGYTNAGKSTLFNRLTQSSVVAEDQLFATLDPTLRKVELPNGGIFLLSDTVGFIANLPTFLIAAFQATLEEVQEADLVLHVRDISHDDTAAQAADVMQTLKILGIGNNLAKPIIEVWNKVDLLNTDHHDSLKFRSNGQFAHVLISALTGQGVDFLLDSINQAISKQRKTSKLCLPHEQTGKPLAWLYEHGEILERADSKTGLDLTVRVQEKSLKEFYQKYGKFLVHNSVQNQNLLN